METRLFRLTVSFLLSAVPVPCGVQKPYWISEQQILPPLSPFYSGCVMCNGVDCGCLLAQGLATPLPLQGGSITDLLREDLRAPERGPFLAGQGRTPGWGSEQCPFVICTVTFIHRAQDTWLREIQAQICQPSWSHTRLQASVSFQRFTGTPFGEKRASHHSTWLCCIIKISCASGNSLLPKRLQNDWRN